MQPSSVTNNGTFCIAQSTSKIFTSLGLFSCAILSDGTWEHDRAKINAHSVDEHHNDPTFRPTCFKSYKSTPPSANKINNFKFPLPGEKRIFEILVRFVFTSLDTFSFKSQMLSLPSMSASTILLFLKASDVIGAIKFCTNASFRLVFWLMGFVNYLGGLLLPLAVF